MDPISHFRNLSSLLLQAQATNREGLMLPLKKACKQAVKEILQKRRKIMLIGNGGSAAIVNHVSNDLCQAVGVKAMVFNESSQLTAISNDHGYVVVFAKPIKMWAKNKDLLIAVSSSGKSENIIRGVEAAREVGCDVMTFSGFEADNPLRKLGSLNFYIASKRYGEVETCHMSLAHYLTDCAMELNLEKRNQQTRQVVSV